MMDVSYLYYGKIDAIIFDGFLAMIIDVNLACGWYVFVNNVM